MEKKRSNIFIKVKVLHYHHFFQGPDSKEFPIETSDEEIMAFYHKFIASGGNYNKDAVRISTKKVKASKIK